MKFLETSAVFSLAFENMPSILFIVRDIVWFIYLNFFNYLNNLKSRLSLMVWVNVVLNRTVVVDSD